MNHDEDTDWHRWDMQREADELERQVTPEPTLADQREAERTAANLAALREVRAKLDATKTKKGGEK